MCSGVSRVHKINPGLFSTVSWDQDLHISSFLLNHKNYNFLDCDWFKKFLFSTNSLVIGQLVIGQFNRPITFNQPITFKLYFKSTNHNLGFNYYTNSVKTFNVNFPFSYLGILLFS